MSPATSMCIVLHFIRSTFKNGAQIKIQNELSLALLYNSFLWFHDLPVLLTLATEHPHSLIRYPPKNLTMFSLAKVS